MHINFCLNITIEPAACQEYQCNKGRKKKFQFSKFLYTVELRPDHFNHKITYASFGTQHIEEGYVRFLFKCIYDLISKGYDDC